MRAGAHLRARNPRFFDGPRRTYTRLSNLSARMDRSVAVYVEFMGMRYNAVMPRYIDLATWPRRQVFEFYLPFDKPYFNVCTRLDVSNLLRELRKREKASIALTYHYCALRAANEIEPFRYRLRAGKVLVHDVINGGTTLMLPNETFTLV